MRLDRLGRLRDRRHSRGAFAEGLAAVEYGEKAVHVDCYGV